MILSWDENAWDDYVWWQTQDRKVPKRINLLVKDVAGNGKEGIGKPEPLKDGFQGFWTRRITDEHRLVYKVDDEIRIAACRYHYGVEVGSSRLILAVLFPQRGRQEQHGGGTVRTFRPRS